MTCSQWLVESGRRENERTGKREESDAEPGSVAMACEEDWRKTGKRESGKTGEKRDLRS